MPEILGQMEALDGETGTVFEIWHQQQRPRNQPMVIVPVCGHKNLPVQYHYMPITGERTHSQPSQLYGTEVLGKVPISSAMTSVFSTPKEGRE